MRFDIVWRPSGGAVVGTRCVLVEESFLFRETEKHYQLLSKAIEAVLDGLIVTLGLRICAEHLVVGISG